MHCQGHKMTIKRAVDIALSSTALALLAPLMIILAALIFTADGRPILYRGKRVGRSAQTFNILKFRTMVTNAEEIGGSVTAGDDPRTTRLGRWLREFKLDELPQFFNVLRGEMSLVGPRPEVTEYVEKLPRGQRELILSVRPGITDWASIWDADEGATLSGCRNPNVEYERSIWPTKVRLQEHYVTTRSNWIDLKLLLYTCFALLFAQWLPPELTRLGLNRNAPGAHKAEAA
jgi:lipopolysaccharide/colanic/teichoic acid biosynthesis glycosyltransferase